MLGMTPEQRIGNALSQAVSYHLAGRGAAARRELAGLIAAGIEDPAVYAALGHVQFELGEYPAAERSFRRLLELRASHQRAPFNLAMCLLRMGRFEDAASWFERAQENDPARIDALVCAAACLLHARLPDRALGLYQRCLMRKCDSADALFGKAAALQQCGRFGEAAEFYERTLAASPEHEGALANLAVLRGQLR